MEPNRTYAVARKHDDQPTEIIAEGSCNVSDFFGIRSLVVTEDQLRFVDVSNLSKLACEILASSDIPAVASLADPDVHRANEAARALARDYFGVVPAGEDSP